MGALKFRRFWHIEDHGEQAKAGWYAAYVLPRPPYVYVYPLVGWALIMRNDEEEIVGLVADREVYEADRPPDGSTFVQYFQRGSWTQEQITELEKAYIQYGKKLENEARQEIRAGRDAPEMGQRRMVQAGARQVTEEALRRVQTEVEGGGPGESPDTPLQ